MHMCAVYILDSSLSARNELSALLTKHQLGGAALSCDIYCSFCGSYLYMVYCIMFFEI